MPAGLRVDLKDGGPVMEITAGLRCPSYGGEFPAGFKNTKTVQISYWKTGARAIVIPRSTVLYDAVAGGWMGLGGYTVSASGLVTQLTAFGNNLYTYPATVWQIFPAVPGANFGLLISDSSDFFSITAATSVGQCIWRGTVNIGTGGWSTPSISGYNRANYLVFAKWDNAGVCIDFDGTTVRAFTEAKTDGDNPATATVEIAIFGAGVAPTPGNGLTIINSAGQCVFSTNKRPFVWQGNLWNPSTSWVTTNGGYVPLGRFGVMSHVRPNTKNQYVFRMLGVKMSGGRVMLGQGKYVGWDVIDQIGTIKIAAVALPVIPDMY